MEADKERVVMVVVAVRTVNESDSGAKGEGKDA